MDTIEISTQSRQEFRDITPQVQEIIRRSGVREGLCYLFCPHTTAGLTLNENWDPTVRHDLGLVLDGLVPDRPDFQHTEGNAPAHAKTTLVGSHLTLFVSEGRLVLGSWQGVFLAEFDGPRHRRVLVKVVAA
ncbi:MAG: secondary thiamine-phosphate synthase enzyme YjbQ [Anaerolineae bacterium]|nr:secondary thiamine-phosphate synthase enzyme YjbQ [Anaerolineae bacterium]MDW8067926.1 secondary thiamine-phosphate synthase enzyme YjbQ [Anaerolineae bacterium]